MNCWKVDKEHIDEIWDEVEPFVRRTDDAYSNSTEIYKDLLAGLWQLWVYIGDTGIEAAATTSFYRYPTGLVLRVETLGGDGIDNWFKHLTSVEDWAKLNGCTGIDVTGRKGWEKLLKPKGYEFEAVILRKHFKR